MKYILATDSFKGSLSSMEVEAEIAEVLTEKGADVVSLPMSDGGDGMLEAFTKALGGTIEPVYVHNQMMRRVDAAFGSAPTPASAGSMKRAATPAEKSSFIFSSTAWQAVFC